MTDFIMYLKDIADSYGIADPDFNLNVSKFLVSHNWFGICPVKSGGQLLMEDDQIEKLGVAITPFCEQYNSDEDEKLSFILTRMTEYMPQTARLYQRYKDSVNLEKIAAYHVADFLLAFLAGELHLADDKEVSFLMECGYDELPKVYGDILADFINWTHGHTRTVYKGMYYMEKYTDRSEESSAYDPDSYLTILYHLFNDGYIDENDMYVRASESKNYVDTWLFLALHFLCALRNSDLIRLPHPRLKSTPQATLEQIGNGTFPEEDARLTINSVIWELEAFMLTPNKTAGTSGVGSIKIHIPASLEIHMGILFAAAEAHFRIARLDPSEPLIRVISTYEQISRYMGDEIGDLFLDANFRSRAANKSYMQMIYLLTDDIIEENDEFRVKGYMLAALARSHKGSYGDFAKTTSIYLKDAAMSGYSPEFVARELFERGVLSLIPGLLLKMVGGEEYKKLSVKRQTEAIKNLHLSPAEIETTVSVMQRNIRRSTQAVNEIYEKHSKEDILRILHRIGNGEAVSKSDRCMCLMTALGKVCPYPGRTNCIGCEYEISTKATMFLMIREVERLRILYEKAKTNGEKKRCKAIATDVVVPCISEMLEVVEAVYGTDAVESLKQVITEASNGKR